MDLDLKKYPDYRSFLRDVLHERRRRNRTYSLRAFAKSLDLSPGMLSYVLNGYKGLSVDRAYLVATRLALPEFDRALFCDIVQAEEARDPEKKAASQNRIAYVRSAMHTLEMARQQAENGDQYQQLNLDVTEMISHCYYLALLDYANMDGASYEPYHVAEQLNISVGDLREAVHRLERLGLLNIEGNRFIKTHQQVTTTRDIPSKAIRTLTLELLDKAKDAIEAQPVERRDFSAMTMAIDTSLLPQAKDMIETFRRELTRFLEGGSRKNGLYCLSIQLFNLISEDTR